jgi:hypothetical protein
LNEAADKCIRQNQSTCVLVEVKNAGHGVRTETVQLSIRDYSVRGHGRALALRCSHYWAKFRALPAASFFD